MNESVIEARQSDAYLSVDDVRPSAAPDSRDVGRHLVTQIPVFSAMFWIGMFVMDTTQMMLTQEHQDWRTIRWTCVLNMFGMVMCLPLGWVIRRSQGWSVTHRLATIGAACVPAAVAYASAGHIIWIEILGSGPLRRPVVTSIAIQSQYNLVFFMLWSAFCAAILYAVQLQERERSLLEARALAHQAELEMLRYQINPHFLFNTLNAVSALIVTGQATAAEAMVGKLAAFFRTALSRESTAKVTLSEDVRVQLDYLDIELLRFPERLRWSVSIEPELMQALVPHLILQPLFENAIKHGVARSKSAIEIRLTARREASLLLITIENDVAASDAIDRCGEGVGLANVERRLAAFYGSAASMQVERNDRRFSVELRLPMEITL